jgi:hypothetical protein
MDIGSWAPVSQPVGLSHVTARKDPCDVAHIMDASPELVVSDELLQTLESIDPEVYGEILFAGRRKQTAATGVKLLAFRRLGRPAVVTNSVGRFKGLTMNQPTSEFPDADLTDLGVPTLPVDDRQAIARMMRSAEPWSPNLGPGWVLDKPAAIRPDRHSTFPVVVWNFSSVGPSSWN